MFSFLKVAIFTLGMFALSSARDPYAKRVGKWFDALSTMYTGDIGAAGVKLNNYPVYRVNVGNRFDRRTLFPVALHSKDVQAYKYKILEIRNGNKRIFGHVVDECAAGDCDENYRKAKKRGAKLVDVHKTAWKPLGLRDFTIHDLRARVVGYVPSKRGSGAMDSVLTSDGRKGYIPSNWKV